MYEAVKQIQKLESRPARNFTEVDEKTIAITPDVYVVKDGDKFVVSDNDRGVQRLYINEALTKQMLKDPQAKEFIGEKLRNASGRSGRSSSAERPSLWGPLGECDIDWEGQIDALAEDGYKGAIHLETHWAGAEGDKLEGSRSAPAI